jgi:hypothetical protein
VTQTVACFLIIDDLFQPFASDAVGHRNDTLAPVLHNQDKNAQHVPFYFQIDMAHSDILAELPVVEVQIWSWM